MKYPPQYLEPIENAFIDPPWNGKSVVIREALKGHAHCWIEVFGRSYLTSICLN